jgi:hypothetical protein
MKRTLFIKLEIEEPAGKEREGGKQICERLESVLRTNEFLADPVTVELVHDTRAKLNAAQLVWKAAQEQVQNLLEPTYFESWTGIMAELVERLKALGIQFRDELDFTRRSQPEGRLVMGMTFGGVDRWLTVTWHRMEVTSHFEVIGYPGHESHAAVPPADRPPGRRNALGGRDRQDRRRAGHVSGVLPGRRPCPRGPGHARRHLPIRRRGSGKGKIGGRR